MGDESLSLRVLDTLASVPPDQWNALAAGHPFLRHEFLHALHETGCVSERTGWLPQYISLWRDDRLEGAMPLYLKSHSRGEYVFDWAWADAYHRHGLPYYPKLLSAIPFSPVCGTRLMAKTREVRSRLVSAAMGLAEKVSSLHVLFPTNTEAMDLASAGMMIRRGVQFHWRNNDQRRKADGQRDDSQFRHGKLFRHAPRQRDGEREPQQRGDRQSWQLTGDHYRERRLQPGFRWNAGHGNPGHQCFHSGL